MRKLAYAINLTIDGCCEHTKVNGSEEIHDYFTNLIRESDLLVYGRTTFQLMVPYWPDVAKNHSGQTRSANEFAEVFDSVDKLVFSHSLQKVEDKRSRIARNGLKEEILKVKQEEGKMILAGGVDLPGQLIALGLVDEFYFVVHPIVGGEGRKLFSGVNLAERLQLRLLDTNPMNSGCVVLHYDRLPAGRG